MTLKSLPAAERPRERLIHHGVENLSLAELLAIVLGSGTQGKSVLELSSELIQKFGTLERLLDASIAELMEIKGIGKAKAIQLKAVFGIGLKCKQRLLDPKPTLFTPAIAYSYAEVEIGHCKEENLLVMLRDIRGALVHRERIGVGTLSQVLAHPREVFYPAVRHKAYSFILAHNHPSGDASPSKADLDLTRNLLLCSRVMEIRLDDHLILGRTTYTSLYEKGFIPKRNDY